MTQQTASDQALAREGFDIAYSVTGSRRPARTIAHGLMSSRAADDAGGFMPWPGLDPSALTLRYDARGHGASGGRQVPDDWRWSALAGDLLDLADIVSPDDPVDALGASMGTATTLWAAVQHPERFRRLVLVIPPTAWETRVGQGAAYLAGADLAEQQGVAAFFEAGAELDSPRILTEGGWGFEETPQIAEPLFPFVIRGAAVSDLPDAEALRGLRMPVLLLPWDGDPGHPVSTSERLAELLPDATLEIAMTPDDVRAWPARIEEFLG